MTDRIHPGPDSRGWLTGLEVEGGRRVWQVDQAGELKG